MPLRMGAVTEPAQIGLEGMKRHAQDTLSYEGRSIDNAARLRPLAEFVLVLAAEVERLREVLSLIAEGRAMVRSEPWHKWPGTPVSPQEIARAALADDKKV
jgi:hypothetical protein